MLSPGTRLGRYEIEATLGAGGMGEVYRACDARLGRNVAVKVLPSALATDADRLRRFELEAKAASQLSHPGILTVHDVGTTGGVPYIVSELLEGENLRERLTRGPLAPRRGVEIAAAVADALAAAHARGIVHRDLKPENLFLTRDGRVKILDFGIAKLTRPDTSDGPAGAPTATIHTDVGVAVGTLGYMAPEQLRGQTADHRADLFALGAILHEMIGGAPAFRRESRIQTVNAVLEADPPELAETVPPGIRRIVTRCLEKAPEARFQSARDLAFALTALTDGATSSTARATARRPSTRRWRTTAALTVAAALAAAGAMAVIWQVRGAAPVESPSIKRFAVHPSIWVNEPPVLSRDGTRIVYGELGDKPRLHLHRLDEFDAKPIEGTEFGRMPIFSPDGAWLAFTAEGKLKKLPLNGGSAVTIADIGNVDLLQGTWSDDDTIVLAVRTSGLMAVSGQGGTPRPLTTPDTASGVIDHHAPSALPGGGLLFTIHHGPEAFKVAVRSPAGEERVLVDDGYHARYVASGHILYGHPDGVFAAPFDLASLQVRGPPILVVDDVLTEPEHGSNAFDVTPDGTLAYIPAPSLAGRQLVWVDRKGQVAPVAAPPRAYDYPSLSTDGKRLAVQIGDGARHDIWTYEFAAHSLTRITQDGANTRPVWSHDGRRIAYSARQGNEWHTMWQPLGGRSAAASLIKSPNRLWPGTWADNGNSLIYVEDPPTSTDSIRRLRIDATSAQPEVLLAAPRSTYFYPHLSPDGQWLAYVAFERGRQVFLRPLDGGSTRQITTSGGGQPRWSRDGTELFYLTRDSLMRVPVRTKPDLQLGKVEKLFDANYVRNFFGPPDYDVAPDGQRFIFVKPADAEGQRPPLHIVLNWSEELKRRVPVQH